MLGGEMMKMSIANHVGLLVICGAVIGLQVKPILSHAAWSGGKATVMGHIDNIFMAKRVRFIDYSYSVDNQQYQGENSNGSDFSPGMPATVTYAKNDPSVSTLYPQAIDSRYMTALVIAILAFLPLLWVWYAELKHRQKAKTEPPQAVSS